MNGNNKKITNKKVKEKKEMEEKELQEIRKRLAEIDVRLLETIMSPPEINSMIEELEDFKKKCKGEKIEKEVVIQYS